MPQFNYSPEDVTFSSVSELFLSEVRKGVSPSIQDFARAFPHLSELIYKQFPSLLLLESTLRKPKQWGSELPETLLGECKIEKEIGRGAMGTVYRAQQNQMGRIVAVKVIPLQQSSTKNLAERFELERHAMARLDHPNIVPVYSYGSDENYAFLIMKFIDGCSLDQLLHEKSNFRYHVLLNSYRTNWQSFAMLGAQVASGLQHAHDQGLVHRDIKPANLLIDKQQKVWITDFGLAKMYDYALSLSRTGEAIGTPRYMAPEQLRGVCDPRSDVYSLGITLYELAAGFKAWENESIESLALRRNTLQLKDIRSVNPEIPEAIAKIIMKACEFDPELRYPTAKEMQFVLERFAEGCSWADRRGKNRTSDEEYRVRSRRNMLVAIVASVAMAITIPTLTYAWTLLRSAPPSLASSTISSADGEHQHPFDDEQPRANFVEKLAGIDKNGFDEKVFDFVKKSVVESSDELKLTKDMKDEIEQQVDTVMTKMQEEKFTGEQVKRFIDAYRETSIPTATRVMSYVRIIQNSGLSQAQKEQGYTILRRLGKSIVNRQLPEENAYALEALLTGGVQYDPVQLSQLLFPNEIIIQWLLTIDNHLATYGIDFENQPFMLSPEIEEALRQASEAE